jgi:hypothetical protein
MTMTKAERAEMEALRTKLALRWSGMTPPERMPLPAKGYVNGWDFNASSNRVLARWTERQCHGFGDEHRTDDGTRGSISGSQNGRRLYATKREALIALRLAQEAHCATVLRRIDAMLEDEP